MSMKGIGKVKAKGQMTNGERKLLFNNNNNKIQFCNLFTLDYYKDNI